MQILWKSKEDGCDFKLHKEKDHLTIHKLIAIFVEKNENNKGFKVHWEKVHATFDNSLEEDKFKF